MKYKLSPDHSGLGKALEIIKDKLQHYKLSSKDIAKNVLASEEVIHALLEHSESATYEVPLTVSYPKEDLPAEKKDLSTVHKDTVAFLSVLFLKVNSKNAAGIAESMGL